MKISIITVALNSSSTIAECVTSVYSQTYAHIEHIIIDGASTDDTLNIIGNTPNRISQIISEPDQGVYEAINKGLNLATSDIIGFLHSDDRFASPLTIEKIVNYFSSHSLANQKNPDVIYGDLVFIDQKNPTKIVRYWKSSPFKASRLNQGWMPAHPTVFMRREVYEKHGNYNIDFKCASDYDFILRVFRDKTLTIYYLPEVITWMRIGGLSTGGFSRMVNKSKEDYWILKRNKVSWPLWILFLKNISKIPQFIFKTH